MNALNPPESRDTVCPECGTDHSDGASARLAKRLDSARELNSALMASNADLLVALKDARRALNMKVGPCGLLNDIDAAIAKAEGTP